MVMTIVIAMACAVLAPSLNLGLIILNITLHRHLGVDLSPIHVAILHHHEGPGYHILAIISHIILSGGTRGGVLPGGDGAEVARAATEEAGHGTGGRAEAGDEHAAQVAADSQLKRH